MKKIRRRPIFHAKPSEEQKKVIMSADVQFSTQKQVQSKTKGHYASKKMIKKMKKLEIKKKKREKMRVHTE